MHDPEKSDSGIVATKPTNKSEIRPCRVDTAETCRQIRGPDASGESLAQQSAILGVAGRNAESRITPGWPTRSMIGGGAVVCDDSLLIPIFSEVPEQRFAPCWIEVEWCLHGFVGSLVVGELSE